MSPSPPLHGEAGRGPLIESKMKKTYIQPEMLTVVLQHTQMLCESITDVSGEGTSYGGGSDEEAHTKEATNVWDEGW